MDYIHGLESAHEIVSDMWTKEIAKMDENHKESGELIQQVLHCADKDERDELRFQIQSLHDEFIQFYGRAEMCKDICNAIADLIDKTYGEVAS